MQWALRKQSISVLSAWDKTIRQSINRRQMWGYTRKSEAYGNKGKQDHAILTVQILLKKPFFS